MYYLCVLFNEDEMIKLNLIILRKEENLPNALFLKWFLDIFAMAFFKVFSE